jgi:superfamily II DNA/RNA helicase
VAEELAPLARSRGRRVVSIHGGVSDRPQRRGLAQEGTIVVACPGRLEDLMGQRALRIDDVRHVVIDEADRMADMGFMPAVRRILDLTHADRQTQLFSATLGGPVATLTRDYQHDPVNHEIESTDPTIRLDEHDFRSVARADRVGVTAQLVAHHGSTVVFCRTRHGAARLTKQLEKFGVKAAELHGGRSQSQRNRALAGFAEGRTQALVATDVAARGIHVDDVACVVHYDLPGEADTYIHRSGRTGRAGASGVVVALVDETAKKAAAALRKELGLGQMPKGNTRTAASADVASASNGTAPAATRPAKQTSATKHPKAARHDRQDHNDRSDRQHRNDRSADRAKPAHPKAGKAKAQSRSADAPRHQPRGRQQEARPSGRRSQHGSEAGSTSGRITKLNARRGYGFIGRDGGEDLFVHRSNLRGGDWQRLSVGDHVEFRVGPGRKGQEALDVSVV